MDNKPELNEQEKNDLREGQVLYELTQSEGFQVVKSWLEIMAFHAWVDPRETDDKEEWEWKELNAFHAANVARELLEKIQASISRSDFLDKKQKGEIGTNKMHF